MSIAQAHSRRVEIPRVGENLYRYSSSGADYAVFRVRGKLKWRSIKMTEKTLARRRLAGELAKASRIDPTAGEMSLEALVRVDAETIRTYDKQTIQTRSSIANRSKRLESSAWACKSRMSPKRTWRPGSACIASGCASRPATSISASSANCSRAWL